MSPPNRADGTVPSLPLVVLAYDDAAVLRALTFLLEIEGYDLEICDSAEMLLALQLPDRRACLVLDQDLSRLSGLETLRTLRDRGAHLPAVLVTGKPHPWVRSAAEAHGACLVEKPLIGEVLLEAIRRALAECLEPPFRSQRK